MQPNDHSTTLIKLWTKTTAINRSLDARLGSIHGIGFTEFMALHHLYASPELKMRRTDLAKALCRSASAVTKMLNPMEKIGLVTKETNPRDLRSSMVKLTAVGLKKFQQASNTLNQMSGEVFQYLDPHGGEQLGGLLTRLNA